MRLSWGYVEKAYEEFDGVEGSGDSSKIKNLYKSLEESPGYEDLELLKNGKKEVPMKNAGLELDLQEADPGEWVKVYWDGYDMAGEEVSLHYHFNKTTKTYFDLKVKDGWSNLKQ